MNKYFYTLIILFIASCGQKENSGEQQNNKALEVSASRGVRLHCFNDIDKTRSKLSTVGIGELGKWRDDDMGGFISITPYYTFGKNQLNNLAYYLESDNQNYIVTLKLILNINNKTEKIQALRKLSEVTKKTFDVINLKLSDSLLNSIAEEKPVTVDQEDFTSELEFQKSNIDTWIIKITSKK
jgi:hypothetical protein